MQDYGDPVAGVTALLKEWGAKEGSSKKGDDTKGKNSDNGKAAKSDSKKDKDKDKDKKDSKSKNNSGGGEGSPEASNNNKDSKKEKMIKYAQDKIGKAKYSQPLRAQAPDYYDCSSLVWFAMKEAGFDVPETIWTTYVMEDDANGPHKYLEKISNSEAKRGDVALFPGHTGILLDEGINMVNAQNPQDGIKNNKTEYFGPMSVARIVGTGAGTGSSGGASASGSDSSDSDSDDGSDYDKRSDAFISITKDYAKELQERIQKTYDRRFEKQQKATEEYLKKVKDQAKKMDDGTGSSFDNPQGGDNDVFDDANGSNSSSPNGSSGNPSQDGSTNNGSSNNNNGGNNSATPSNPLTPNDVKPPNPNTINGSNGSDGKDATASETISTEELNLVNKILNKTNSIYNILVKTLNQLLEFNSDDDPNIKVLNEILEATNGGVNLSSQEVTILNEIYNKLPEDKQSEINPLLADPVLRGW